MKMQRSLTVDEFVAWEESQERKYEFCDGEISRFPGGSLAHSLIATNIILALRSRGLAPAAIMNSDVKVVTDHASRYPDVTVLGGDARDRDMRATFARHPAILFEVLSPSTRAIDRGPKSDEYLAIDSLHEYVLIDSVKRWTQVYRRVEDGWRIDLPVTSGELAIPSLRLTIPFDEIYAGTGV